jgi:APA family basic amino acid/polyamine antiporter
MVNLPAIIIILLIKILVRKGVKESMRFNNLIFLLKIGIVLLFVFAGIKYIKPENRTLFMPFGLDGVVTSAATATMGFFLNTSVKNMSK